MGLHQRRRLASVEASEVNPPEVPVEIYEAADDQENYVDDTFEDDEIVEDDE